MISSQRLTSEGPRCGVCPLPLGRPLPPGRSWFCCRWGVLLFCSKCMFVGCSSIGICTCFLGAPVRTFPGNEKTMGHYVINYISHVFEMHVYEQSRSRQKCAVSCQGDGKQGDGKHRPYCCGFQLSARAMASIAPTAAYSSSL